MRTSKLQTKLAERTRKCLNLCVESWGNKEKIDRIKSRKDEQRKVDILDGLHLNSTEENTWNDKKIA